MMAQNLLRYYMFISSDFTKSAKIQYEFISCSGLIFDSITASEPLFNT